MYIENGKFYIAEEGYCFLSKSGDGITGTMIYKDRINGYDYIERPVEPIVERNPELDDSEIIPELTDSERIANLEQNLLDTNERIEFVEDCLIEMSETVYG